MKLLREKFQETGFCVLKAALPYQQIKKINQTIQTMIKHYADELECSLADYLAHVSRWHHPSRMTEAIYDLIESPLKKLTAEFIGNEVKLAKMNIISKSIYANQPVPCHQDIAYSPENPYEFSFWLALHEVNTSGGVLEFLPGSHREEIVPAIDFWNPEFVDTLQRSTRWKNQAISIPLQVGDIIVFDSCIWHRSAYNTSGKDRFALVTRWSQKSYQPPNVIPEKIPAPFGMWTCGLVTKSILKQGLVMCSQLPVVSADWTTCIALWKKKLSEPEMLPFSINGLRAQRSLKGVSILDRAATLHNGGDAQGSVYANLWRDLLQPLSKWIKHKKYKAIQ
ncbi:MAG: phytanoyl-CoA dioxygenase family protein [Coxiella endosymbiont of Haemaphysalis qinghaiensis]